MNGNGHAGTEEEVQHAPPQSAAEHGRDRDKTQPREDGRAKGPGRAESDDEGKDEREAGKPPWYKRPVVLIIAGLVLLVLIVGGVLYWLHARQFVSTDDAYIDGHVTQISPQIPALLLALHVTDNQLVAKGDLLAELDPTEYQVALEQAEAQLATAQGRLLQAQAQVDSAKAAVVQARAAVAAAEVTYENNARDLQRYEQVDARARSQQRLDSATAAAKSAQADLEQAKAREASTAANVTTSEAAVKAAEGELRTAQANVKRAQVSLSDCRIYAPGAGRVTQRTIEAGAYVQTGQVLFSLVAPDVWVTANYKETQLRHMRPGQPATITVDAFPSRKFHGHVDSIQAGSGSRFSMLPAENATGNFVKVVQRVPVKIVFDHGANTNDGGLLSPGLSVIPKVKIR